jgi:hypothetical protein
MPAVFPLRHWHAAGGRLRQRRPAAPGPLPAFQGSAGHCAAEAPGILQGYDVRRSSPEAPPVGRSSTVTFLKYADASNNPTGNRWFQRCVRASASLACPGRRRTNYNSVHWPPRYASYAWARKTPALRKASKAVTSSVIVVLPSSPCRERRSSKTRGKSS